jgi:signal transduction histidine kinase
MDRACPRTLVDEVPLCRHEIDPNDRPAAVTLDPAPSESSSPLDLQTCCPATCPKAQVAATTLLGFAHALARNRQTADRLQRHVQLHEIVARCNRLIGRSLDERTLLDAFCFELIQSGGYGFAWIGYCGGRSGTRMRPVTYASRSDPGFTAAHRVSVDMNEAERTFCIIRETGAPVVLRDPSTNSREFAAWLEQARNEACRSAIVLPLNTARQSLGIISLFADRSDAFEEHESALLAELARDLASGIGTLRARARAANEIRRLREETERDIQTRLAATLHDGVGQTLQALNLDLKMARAIAQRGDPLPAARLDRLVAECAEALRDLRTVNVELHASFLDWLPFAEAIRLHCSKTAERIGTPIELHLDGVTFVLDEQTRLQCFLAFREVLSNAARHAHASRIGVYLRVRSCNGLTLVVIDNGVGIQSQGVRARGSGLGLNIIRERVAAVRGRVDIRSRIGRGTLVRIRIPLSGGRHPCP